MDSEMLSLTCACVGATEEDDNGGVVGYVKGDHCLDTAPTLFAFPRQGLHQGKPLSLEAHGPDGDRPEKPRRYGVTEMRSPCYSFRPAHPRAPCHCCEGRHEKAWGIWLKAGDRVYALSSIAKSYVSPPGMGFSWTSD